MPGLCQTERSIELGDRRMTAESKPRPDDEPKTAEVACPHCAALAKPLRVSTRKGDSTHVDVTMRCDDCDHTWIVQKLTIDKSIAPT
jgi:hypothetical protein